MTESEVESILGQGEEIKSEALPSKGNSGSTIKTMKWERGSTRIDVVFSDGKVALKNLSTR
jgi:hypothetical protein